MLVQGEGASDDWCLVELLEDGALERIMGDHECLFDAAARWRGPGEFRLRQDPRKLLMDQSAKV